uniref:Uncharacterized protein n=1 Tax=Favella ehrenbergii TaxID=182087 RepID=A0A7S3HYY2_9SPIT
MTVLLCDSKRSLPFLICSVGEGFAALQNVLQAFKLTIACRKVKNGFSKLITAFELSPLVAHQNVQDLLRAHLCCRKDGSFFKSVHYIRVCSSQQKISHHFVLVCLRSVVKNTLAEAVDVVQSILGSLKSPHDVFEAKENCFKKKLTSSHFNDVDAHASEKLFGLFFSHRRA